MNDNITYTKIKLKNILNILGEIPSKYSLNLILFLKKKIEENKLSE